MNLVERIKSKISMVSRVYTILKNIASVEIKSNGTVHVELLNDVVIKTEKNIVVYSKEGCLITSSKRTYINPEIKKEIKDYIDNKKTKEELLHELDLEVKRKMQYLENGIRD